MSALLQPLPPREKRTGGLEGRIGVHKQVLDPIPGRLRPGPANPARDPEDAWAPAGLDRGEGAGGRDPTMRFSFAAAISYPLPWWEIAAWVPAPAIAFRSARLFFTVLTAILSALRYLAITTRMCAFLSLIIHGAQPPSPSRCTMPPSRSQSSKDCNGRRCFAARRPQAWLYRCSVKRGPTTESDLISSK